MKILHCADIHLGKRPFGTKEFTDIRYNDFFNVFEQMADIAILEKVDVIAIAGDLYDKKNINPDILKRSEKTFKRLKENNITVILTEGNHDDKIGDEEIDSWHQYIESEGYVKRLNYRIEKTDGSSGANDGNTGTNEGKIQIKYVFDKIKIKDVNFYGVGYPGFAVDNVLNTLYDELDPNEKNYVLVHTAVDGSDFLPGLVQKETLNKLRDRVIYIAGGHFHNYSSYPKEDPFFFVPGSLEYWDISRGTNHDKGVIILDTDTMKTKFVSVTPRKLMKVKISCHSQSMEEVKKEFEDQIKKIDMSGKPLVILDIYVNMENYMDLTPFERITENNGALRSYINVHLKSENISSGNVYEGESTIKSMEESIIGSWKVFKDPVKIADYLEKYKDIQDSGDKDRENEFLEIFDKMLEEEIANEDK